MEPFGRVQGLLGELFGGFGLSWGVLGALLELLGEFWDPFGRVWGLLGDFFRGYVLSWGLLWPLLGLLRGFRGS